MASRDYLKHVVATSEPTDSTLGDEWYNPSTNILSKRLVVNGTTVRFVPLGGGLAVQQSGSTIVSNTSTLNFPGASVAHNPITGVTDISASGVPGGFNTQIQFNNSGAFAGSSNLTWNNSSQTLALTGFLTTFALSRSGNVNAVSWTTASPVFNSAASVLTDTTGSGTIAIKAGNSFLSPNFASTASTTITDAVNLYVNAAVASTNTSITNNWSLYVAGNQRITGTLFSDADIQLSGSRVVDFKNSTAQWSISGGGLVTWTGSAVLWNQRILVIPVARSIMSSAGYFEIACPTSGTVTYYNSVNVTTTVTATAAGIPLAAYEALYYELNVGGSNASEQTRFRVVNYLNSTWRPSTGWILIAAVNGDGTNIGHLKWLPGQVNLPTTGATVTYNTGTGVASWASATGTVTSVSVVSANGFTGTVATASSTPAITLTTSITGLLKGNGTAIQAATAGTDYQTAQSVTGIVKSSGTTRSAAVAGTDYSAGTSALVTGILKSTTTTGALSIAVAGTDYQTAQSVTGIVKSSGTTRSAAVAGTDYVAPSGTFFIGTTSIAHNRASASLSLTGVSIDGSAGVGTTVTTTASTTNSNFKIPMLNTTGVATGNFGLLLDSAGASDFTFNPSTNLLTVGGVEIASPTPATVNAIRARSNIAWLSPSATSTITSKMLDSGTLSFEGSVGQLFSVTNSMTGTIFSVNDISGIPSIEVLDTGVVKLAQYAGFVAYGVSSALNSGAGTTQGTALALTRPINDVTTVAANTGVILPTATAGMRIIIRNGGANTLNVYPASGGQINTLGTNIAFPHTTSTVLEFIAFSTTQWYTLNSTYA